jgi:multidrug resistance efflux pump
MRRVSRFILYGILLCVLILAIVLFVLVFGRMDETVEAFGKVFPFDHANVAPEVSGIIKQVKVREGDQVKDGDTLLLLVSDDLKFQVERSRQALADARSRLFEAEEDYRNLTTSESFEISAVLADLVAAKRRMEIEKTNYERQEELFKRGLISEEEKERAKLGYDVTESNYRVLEQRKILLVSRYQHLIEERQRNVELAQQAYDLAQQRLEKTVILAPISGAVLTPNIDELIGTKAIEGQPIIQIGNLSQMKFIVNINETDIPKVDIGQEAKIYINAFPHRRYKVFEGKITEVSLAPQVTKSGVIFETKIEIDEPWVEVSEFRLYLKPGLSGKAKIVIKPNVRLIEKIFKGIAK